MQPTKKRGFGARALKIILVAISFPAFPDAALAEFPRRSPD